MKPILPIIHQNGTHPDSLIEALSRFRWYVATAQEKIGTISPNGRDYYPDPGRMDLAVEQHQRRSKVLTDLIAELDAEILGIMGQCRTNQT